mgnify:CR=1 FL=1
MKLHLILVLGLVFGVVGCAEKEQVAPEQAGTMEDDMSAVAEETAVEAEAMPAPTEDWRDSNFMDHMHVHAEQLDDLNFALDDGDLEAAMTPAYWLSRHKTVGGLPEDLQPFLVRMREAARAVEEAEDIDAARAAAQQIGAACQECHAAVGVATQ